MRLRATALRPDRQALVVLVNHSAPHLSIQVLSFCDKKSLAAALESGPTTSR
jgi:hypothetical protein